MTTYLTVDEVADRWRVSKMSVYRMVHNGTLAATTIGRNIRIDADAVTAYENARTPTTNDLAIVVTRYGGFLHLANKSISDGDVGRRRYFTACSGTSSWTLESWRNLPDHPTGITAAAMEVLPPCSRCLDDVDLATLPAHISAALIDAAGQHAHGLTVSAPAAPPAPPPSEPPVDPPPPWSVVVRIAIGNAATVTTDDDGNPIDLDRTAVHDLLRDAAAAIADGRDRAPLIDANGSTVGAVTIHGGPHE